MNSFLTSSRETVLRLASGQLPKGYKRIRIVLGNETCDLDSAVSTLIQAFSEHLVGLRSTTVAVIPVMNIFEREYLVKTEVVFYLTRHDITRDLLTFRDQIDLKNLAEDVNRKLEVVLVDHHTLRDEDAFLVNSVVKVIDHRPRDPNWLWPDIETRMEIVGSCATLVGRSFCDKHPEAVDSRISSLLLGPILIDTCNLSIEAGRAKDEDFQMVEKLGNIAFPSTDDRVARATEIFREIVEAKADISKLTADDLLIKDLKVIGGVPFVGLPILVENFLGLSDALKALRNFAESRKATVVILMGLEVRSGKLSRDIAVSSFSFSRTHRDITGTVLREKIIKTLMSPELSLELKLLRQIEEWQIDKWKFEDGTLILDLYTVGNIRASRKQIVPFIRNLMNQEETIATGSRTTREPLS
ncbi:Exopolyphosphatase PRUNE1 [Anthophora plagiata]